MYYSHSYVWWKSYFITVCFHRHVSQHALGQTPPGIDPPRQTPSLGRHPLADTPPGRPPQTDTTPSRHHPKQTPLLVDTPLGRFPSTATAADGMHPTGMHSCLIYRSNMYEKNWYVRISTRIYHLNSNTKMPNLADLPSLPALCNYGKN